MAHKSRFRPTISEQDGYEGYADDMTHANTELTPYAFGRSAQDAYSGEGNMPLFLTDPDGEPDPEEFMAPLRRRGMASVSSKILIAVVAASGVAMLLAWFSSDATRDIIVDAKASISAALPTPSATAEADAAQLKPADLQLREPARAAQSSPIQSAVSASPQTPAAVPVVVANAAPSREDIATAYQNALQTRAPTPPPASPPAETVAAVAPATLAPAAVAPATLAPAAAPTTAAPTTALQTAALAPADVPQATEPQAVTPQAAVPHAALPQSALPQAAPPKGKRIDPQALAVLMKRARDMLAAGDIPAARLLLERAAEGQDAKAALLLARTYDPAALGTQDVRNITPEPDKARFWYQRAAQLGSSEAQRSLAQLPN